MQDFHLQGWTFRYDSHRTQEFYEAITLADTPFVRNFLENRDSFPAELSGLLQIFGASPLLPYELFPGVCDRVEQKGEYILYYPICGEALHPEGDPTYSIDLGTMQAHILSCHQIGLTDPSPGEFGFVLEIRLLLLPWKLTDVYMQEGYSQRRFSWKKKG